MTNATVEVVATLPDSMPSGITVTPNGRIFLCFPRWVDRVPFTVGELCADGTVKPFPDLARNRLDPLDPVHHFFSVQSVVATSEQSLWVLDTGRPYFAPALPGAAKLVEVDLASGALRRIFVMPRGIARISTYVNDVRFANTIGTAGTAFITDSAVLGPSALIVVDLATGKKLRRLSGTLTVNPDPAVKVVIDGQVLAWRFPLGITLPYRNGADGIALSPDERTLYYCPLDSRRLYSVDATVLADPSATDADVEATLRDLGQKCVSDGLECDADGDIYAGDLEHQRIVRRPAQGPWSTFVEDGSIRWTDTLSVAADGYLYFTVNQVNRMWPFQGGHDRRVPPYLVLRAKR